MPVYKETETPTTVRTWYAARRVILENPYNGVPTAVFDEVERTAIGEQLLTEKPTYRQLEVPVQSPGILIPYINPETYEQLLDAEGQPIEGQCFTDEQFAYFVACVYIYAAKTKDQSP